MRKLIAAMKLSLDGKFEGPDGMADWAASWADDYGLTAQIDACVLGGRMYPGYETYWSDIAASPEKPAWITGLPPTAGELAWSDFAKRTPHYVLSKTIDPTSIAWSNTHLLRDVDELVAMKRAEGKDIYLMGGGELVASLIEAGVVDELRLIVYPVIAGDGKSLFPAPMARRDVRLSSVEPLDDGLVRMTYAVSS